MTSIPKPENPAKPKFRVGKFAIVGAILALANFLIYTFLARVVMNSNDLLWLDSIISYALATILAYFMHSKITWKERPVTKRGILMFFLWNGLTAFAISPFFTWLFGFASPLYEFAHGISTALHLPFDYNFVESTGIFVLTTCVTMILNYIFYDKLVFGDQKIILPENNRSAKNHTPTFKNHTPKISVIVPVYNTAKYLPDCINSIINQTYRNLEILLIDDGSADDCAKIVDDFAKKDHRITAFHQKNGGQSSARNFGLQVATGDFISFIDGDDKVKPDFIKSLLAPFTEETSLSVCGIHYKRLRTKTAEDVYITPLPPRKQTETKKSYILKLLALDGRLYSSVNKLYRADVAKTLKFDESLNFAEDTKFVLDYLKKSAGEIAFVLKPLYIYNFGTETSTMRTTSISWQNWQTSYQNLKSWLGKAPTAKEIFWLHTVHLRWRISHLKSVYRSKS